MSTIIFTDPTDDQLNAAFAEHVAGWRRLKRDGGNQLIGVSGPSSLYSVIPVFTASFDAVLPWLAKHDWWQIEQDRGIEKTHPPCWCSIFYHKDGAADYDTHVGQAHTPAKAAVLALLRARGLKVEFTK